MQPQLHSEDVSINDVLIAQSGHFLTRLAKLNQVTLRLSQITTFDDLGRQAIELGLQELAFDRLGILLLGDEPNVLYGFFGTDEYGQLRDERSMSTTFSTNSLLLQYIRHHDQRQPHLLDHGIVDYGKVLNAAGWNAVVGLWEHNKVIGYLFADNLLYLHPYTQEDNQIFAQFAAALGHLITHLRIEQRLSERRSAANFFLGQMSELSAVVATLTRCGSFDELCYKAVELGRSHLGFDRLGLWFTQDDPDQIIGSYGTDLHGQIRDERGVRFAFSDDRQMGLRLNQRERYAFEPSLMLSDGPNDDEVHYGWKAAAALWNGEQIIGYLFTDNLLLHRPYSESEGELLSLYALLLGHLCSRMRIEEALRERENSYRTLIDAIPDYMFVITRDGLILNYHEAQPATLNISLAEMVGKYIHDVVYAKAANLYMDAIERAFATGKVATFEYPLRYDNALYHFEVRVTAGNGDKTVVLVRDITNSKLLEEQLVASQKMESLGRMASGIAHDFNNLLTVIQGFASVAKTLAAPDVPRLTKALERIAIASEKGAQLTNHLLLFAKKQVVQPKVFRIQEQIQGLTTILKPLLGDGIVLTVRIDRDLGAIYMDPGQFEQIMINLAVNARDAMPSGGRLTIAASNVTISKSDQNPRLQIAQGSYVRLKISDTGIGMDEEVQKQIFEPFFTTKETGKGTGLGLAICHGIVQQNGGHIEVESVSGAGSTFLIYLPLSQSAKSGAIVAARHPIRNGSETILLVEDDEPVRAIAMEVLTTHGYTVIACTNGQEALHHAKSDARSIDLLMTDMVMPQMSGHEVAEQFMALRPSVPVLLVSGYVGELPDILMAKPNVRFLSKPFTIHGLTDSVRALLDMA